jgi:hypothetical protein
VRHRVRRTRLGERRSVKRAISQRRIERRDGTAWSIPYTYLLAAQKGDKSGGKENQNEDGGGSW